MATIEPSRRNKIYEKLKQTFKTLRATLNPYLDEVTLSELGIDCTYVNLYQETEQGGTYFLPMPAARAAHLDLPDFDLKRDELSAPWSIPNAMWLDHALLQHVTGLKDGSECSALEMTKWKFSG